MQTTVAQKFWNELKKRPAKELKEMLKKVEPDLYMQVERIEWVFKRKLNHLTWNDGSKIQGRPFTSEELAYLFDPPFEVDLALTRLGISTEQQRQVHIASDPVMWGRHFLGVKPHAYQILMLRYPKNRKVLRAGRRLGKTFTMAMKMLHYSYVHNHGRTLVLTPMKSQSEVIFKELGKLVEKSDVVKSSIQRAVTSPYHMMEFKNGSTIRFFSTGMKSGGKSDVARGQEAHLIVLDELDYMGPEDLDAILAMLQKTGAAGEAQVEKELIGASTPTGRREKFWEWCVDPKKTGRFKEFWFPSYCNPNFDAEVEQEFRDEYSEMVYRHEIEADWGEDTEGVYPRRYVDLAYNYADWDYVLDRTSARSFHTIGVDWDKYGAGTNIVVVEVCGDDYEDELFRGKVRVVWREETIREEFSLTRAVDRIIELNNIFKPRHIYIDRGYGEVQLEMLHQYGVEHPDTGLRKKVVGISFSEMLTMRDPATKQPVKKDMKPFLVDNLRQYLEREQIVFPNHDEWLYRGLIGYIVVRTTQLGRPVFEGGEAGDHAHDALALALLAITQNYGELMRLRLARHAVAVSNETFLPMFEVESEAEEEIAEQVYGSVAPVMKRRAMAGRGRVSRTISRRSF